MVQIHPDVDRGPFGGLIKSNTWDFKNKINDRNIISQQMEYQERLHGWKVCNIYTTKGSENEPKIDTFMPRDFAHAGRTSGSITATATKLALKLSPASHIFHCYDHYEGRLLEILLAFQIIPGHFHKFLCIVHIITKLSKIHGWTRKKLN